MSPRHHPSEAALLDFASGSLELGVRLVLSGHLGACEGCRAIVAEGERIGGALLAGLPPAAMMPEALALALAQIERPSPTPARALPKPEDWITVPHVVLEAARARRRWVAPGVWIAPVAGGHGDHHSYLLRVAAGMSMPRHSHRGPEMICVLKGSYRDGETLHGPGDFALNDETVDHRPTITDDGECICLVAAEGNLVPRDWVGRLFQPIAGI